MKLTKVQAETLTNKLLKEFNDSRTKYNEELKKSILTEEDKQKIENDLAKLRLLYKQYELDNYYYHEASLKHFSTNAEKYVLKMKKDYKPKEIIQYSNFKTDLVSMSIECTNLETLINSIKAKYE